jgi:acetyl esterase/lipase
MKNIPKSARLLVFVLIFFVACKKETNDNNTILPKQELFDVAYGSDQLQKMDVYLPEGRTDTGTKIVIMIHGGAWIEGDKSDFNDAVDVLQSQLSDFALFNINYRLLTQPNDTTWTDLWPAQLEDVNNAFDFILSKAGEYHINANEIIVAGASAGAHLALLEGYEHNTDNHIKAVIDLFGPTDMKALYNSVTNILQSYIQVFMNGTPETNPDNYYSASPLFFVNSNSPPTQIFHGTADPLVPISQSDSLNNRLTAAGVLHEYNVYEGEGHGWTGDKLNDTYSKIISFIKSNVK